MPGFTASRDLSFRQEKER